MSSPTGRPLLPSATGHLSAADRLLAMSGLSRAEFLAAFSRKNVLDGGEWDRVEAARAATRMKLRGHVVVLGRAAWRALGLPRSPFFSEIATSAATFHLVPHPSESDRQAAEAASDPPLILISILTASYFSSASSLRQESNALRNFSVF